MTLLTSFIGYFVVGFIEMFLATQRTYWISKGRSNAAAVLVFFENFLAIFVIYQIANHLHGNFLYMVAYAVGNAIGTYINLEKVPF
jgi:hypothetical protein